MSDLSNTLRSQAASWRTLLNRSTYETEKVPHPGTEDPGFTAIEHAAQTLKNIGYVLSLVSGKSSGDSTREIVTLDKRITTVYGSELAEITIDSLTYKLADSLGRLADSAERNAEAGNAVEQLAADNAARIRLIEQHYAALDERDS